MRLQNENMEDGGGGRDTAEEQYERAEWLQLAGNPKPKLYPQMNLDTLTKRP